MNDDPDEIAREQVAAGKALAKAYKRRNAGLAEARAAIAEIDGLQQEMSRRNDLLQSLGHRDKRVSPDVVRVEAIGDATGDKFDPVNLKLVSKDLRDADRLLRDLSTNRRVHTLKSTVSLGRSPAAAALKSPPGGIHRARG